VPSDSEIQGGAGPVEAQVKWYNARKGFGFVLGPDGQDVFFHASALTEAGIEPPETGDTLVCEIGTDRQGRRLVTRITERKLGDGAPAEGARRPFRDGPPGGGFNDRPPRRDFGGGGFNDRPPRRDFGGPPGAGFGDRPPRRISPARRVPASARRAPPSATGRRRGASSAGIAMRAGRPMR
jgi:CspA family cold shock protein